MTIKQLKSAAAFSLIEVMIAMVILAIAALGALGYQYHAARQSQIANAQMTASRTGQLLLEDWKSTGGSTDYDPTQLDLGFTAVSTSSSDIGQSSGLGAILNGNVYSKSVDKIQMLIMLLWKDVATDSVAQVTLRQLAVVIRPKKEKGQPQGDDDSERTAEMNVEAYHQPITLTTYVRLDAAGG